MIDFSRIRGEGSGQRDAFEELVCQLAHRVPPVGAAEYRRIDGAGGDGGVEAYWTFPDGSKYAYQAKFHTRSGDIDWRAIDKSVAAALEAHPTLKRYNIAIACDPSGLVPKRPGKSGVERWTEHEVKWQAEAKARGMTVAFELWSASLLDNMLNLPAARGLREFWFGELDLSEDWLARHFDRTVAALEERYHPEDHVDVSARSLFDGLLRNDSWRSRLRDLHGAVVKESQLHARRGASTATEDAFKALVEGVREFRSLAPTVDKAAEDAFPRQRWIDSCAAIDDLVYKAQEAVYADISAVRVARNAQGELPDEADPTHGNEFQYSLHEISKLRAELRSLQDHLNRDEILADASRFALVEGRAGSGKSHLLANEVGAALADGTPCLFMIGTQFAGTAGIEPALLSYFDLTGCSFETLLGALSTVAEKEGQRALIVVDAINEGAGIALWKPHLSSFAAAVLRYPNIALCVSCRSEYKPALVSAPVSAMATTIVIRGFETDAEQEAAASVYMDRRGIIRPATAWLNPEFTNPLFLRTACIALERAGRTEFPKGLRGNKELLRFFLDATGDALGSPLDGTGQLVGPLARSMLALAREMAKLRQDYLAYRRAAQIIDSEFAGFVAPAQNGSWLETLKHNGLLRFDPDPGAAHDDPLVVPEDVVRFSFQRFQDHLMAEAILAGIDSPGQIFGPDGFQFIIDRRDIVWSWRGLFEALSSLVPEKFGREVVDLLPGDPDIWWLGWSVQRGFVESVRWRAVDAFTDRSLQLLNTVDQHDHGIQGLLIELSLVENHPWNGDLLHKNLTRRGIAKRDEFWTVAVNDAYDEPGHPANRLIDWAIGSGPTRADDMVVRLALQTLAWCCSSTAKPVRDGATKSMVALLLDRPGQFSALAAAFAGVDDLYVLERVYAAAYGACCLNPSSDRLATYSDVTYEHIFKGRNVPPNILLRDYAHGIVEIAKGRGHLGRLVVPDECSPPFGAGPPILRDDKEKILARSKRLGARSITSSCFDGIADFGRYVCESRVHAFSNAPLSGSPPMRTEDLYDRCLADLASGRPEVELAFLCLEKAYERPIPVFDRKSAGIRIMPPDASKVKAAERALRKLVTPEEYARYRRECVPKLKGDREWQKWAVAGRRKAGAINAQRVKYWVANRAMAMGWTDKLFPYDGSRGENRVRGSKVERIGKKYQWIALYELLARLADNYWMAPGDEPARIYSSMVDVSFIRDIDPTVLPGRTAAPNYPIPVLPRISVPGLTPSELRPWIEDKQLPKTKPRLALCEDSGATDWVALYRYDACDVDADEEMSSLESPYKQTEFHFLTMHVMRPETQERLLRVAKRSKYDFHQWLPHDEVDGPYLGELGVRPTWPGDMWRFRSADRSLHGDYEFASPAVGYQWESHLDGSLPDGLRAHVPQRWLLEALDLRAAEPGAVYVDGDGVPVVVSSEGDHHSYCLVRKDRMLSMLEAKGLRCVWAVIGERMAWWKSNSVRGLRVRHNGMLWFDDGRVHTQHWHEFD